MKTYIETRIKELKEELRTLPESSEDAYYVRGVMDGLEEMKMFSIKLYGEFGGL